MRNVASNKQKTACSGFTLIETLVAITIMTLAVLAPFQAVERVTSESRLAEDQLIASSLAQEGLEYVRFVRGNNYLAHPSDFASANHQLDGMNGSGGPNCRTPNTCTIDAEAAALAACSGTCPALTMDTANGFYTQHAATGGYTTTLYTRTLTLTQFAGYEQATITITWTDHGAQTMTISENFYDWF